MRRCGGAAARCRRLTISTICQHQHVHFQRPTAYVRPQGTPCRLRHAAAITTRVAWHARRRACRPAASARPPTAKARARSIDRLHYHAAAAPTPPLTRTTLPPRRTLLAGLFIYALCHRHFQDIYEKRAPPPRPTGHYSCHFLMLAACQAPGHASRALPWSGSCRRYHPHARDLSTITTIYGREDHGRRRHGATRRRACAPVSRQAIAICVSRRHLL